MVVGGFTDEYVSPFPPSKTWKARVVDSHNLLPKALPERLASIEIIRGDGGVGTIRQINFASVLKNHTFVKDRIDVIDHDKYLFKYTIIEGGFIGKSLKWYSVELTFEPTVDGGSKSKITVEYDTIDGETLTEANLNTLKGGLKGMAKAVDDYLQANPDAYA